MFFAVWNVEPRSVSGLKRLGRLRMRYTWLRRKMSLSEILAQYGRRRGEMFSSEAKERSRRKSMVLSCTGPSDDCFRLRSWGDELTAMCSQWPSLASFLGLHVYPFIGNIRKGTCTGAVFLMQEDCLWSLWFAFMKAQKSLENWSYLKLEQIACSTDWASTANSAVLISNKQNTQDKKL